MKANSTQEKNDINPERAETSHGKFILELMSGKSVDDYSKAGLVDNQEKHQKLNKVPERKKISRVDEQIEKIVSSVRENGEHQKIRSYSRAGKKSALDNLKTRSKIFARILREIGCKNGAPICCLMRNSIDFFTVLWGIKYAGCKAVPVDPNQPINQIQSVISDSKTEWLIVDRSAKLLLGAEVLGENSLNIAWMDSAEMIPENCFPEFSRDNIDHISMYPVYPEPDKTEPVITFHTFDDTQLKKNTFTHEDVKKAIYSILETINIQSDSKIAGFMRCNSPSVLLEEMSLFYSEALLFLFDPHQKCHSSFFIREINRLNITHLFLEAEMVKRILPQILSGNILNSSVNTVVLWGEKLSEETLNRLKTVFPNATIYTVFMDPDKNISIRTAKPFTSRLIHSS